MEFTIPRQVQFAAKEFAAIDGIVDGDIRLTFAEVGEQVLDVAGAFVAAGLQPGERVAVWAPNMAEWVLGAMGALSAGAILVPLNTRYKGMEAADILQRSKATILLTVSGFLGNDYVTMLNASGAELPDLRTTIVLRGDAPTGTIAWADFVATSTPKHRATAERRIAAQSPDDVSDILFTAGTTGRSKGVMTTHEQAIRVFDAWSSIVGVEAGDRYLVVNPFFHSFGYKAGIIACFVSGATIVPEPVFDVPTVLAHIEAEQITVLPGAPTVYFSILNHPDR
ncbi:MAG TPA: AMP-binding protein, partial [Ilumatobacteraceae bacterium]|nr:AMP-binding protein [Ilumatobacteraceae bacterium]